MANVDTPRGFLPRVPLRCTPYNKDVGAVACYPGDLMEVETDGSIIPVAAGDTAIYGAAADYSVASTVAAAVGVYDDPNQEFIAQDDGSDTAPTQALAGSNCDILATTGSTTTLLSLQEIATSTSTTATANVRLIRGVDSPGNDITAVNADWIVLINEHAYKSTTGI